MAAIRVFQGFHDGSSIYHVEDSYFYYHNNDNNYAINGNVPVHYLRCKNYAGRGCRGSAKVTCRPEGPAWENITRHTCGREAHFAGVRELQATIVQQAVLLNGPYENPAAVVERVRNG